MCFSPYLECRLPPSVTIFLFSYFVRLTGTAWNLAQNDSKNIVGFSGTNDNHRILPLQVCQYFASKDRHPDPVLKQLDGTNGKMLNIMMENVMSSAWNRGATFRFAL